MEQSIYISSIYLYSSFLFNNIYKLLTIFDPDNFNKIM